MPVPQPIPDNPSGEKFADMADDGARYRVASNTGRHSPGDVVAARDLGPGAQLDRLVRLGVLAPMTEDEIQAHEAGAAPAAAAPGTQPSGVAIDERTDPRFSTGGHGIAAGQAALQQQGKEGEGVAAGPQPVQGDALDLPPRDERTGPSQPTDGADKGAGKAKK